jgi:hypothetical protein
MKMTPRLIGFLQALGLTAYISLVATFIQTMNGWFRNQQPTPVAGTVLILLLFIFSALVSASIILGYPAKRFLAGDRSGAVHIIAWSAFWMVVIVIGLVIYLAA